MMAFHRKEIGEQTAGEHDDETGMGEMNAELAPGPMETFGVSRDQIDEQHRADEVAPGEDRNLETATLRRPPDEQTLKIALLRFVNAKMNLGNRAGKDERHGRSETNDRQLQRRDKIDKSTQHLC